ncbi:hypothetical protein AMTR_s00078p00179260 [Amborella trichopoda]|uniref:Uncharacterized protein n=1 Tax=Amborella trichopoda TaxID=13333 RepID=W1PA69_AMBTC|nr:hypothetical protein AMTR_s00078p00179260 [Amborella trichopoda]
MSQAGHLDILNHSPHLYHLRKPSLHWLDIAPKGPKSPRGETRQDIFKATKLRGIFRKECSSVAPTAVEALQKTLRHDIEGTSITKWVPRKDRGLAPTPLQTTLYPRPL